MVDGGLNIQTEKKETEGTPEEDTQRQWRGMDTWRVIGGGWAGGNDLQGGSVSVELKSETEYQGCGGGYGTNVVHTEGLIIN